MPNRAVPRWFTTEAGPHFNIWVERFLGLLASDFIGSRMCDLIIYHEDWQVFVPIHEDSNSEQYITFGDLTIRCYVTSVSSHLYRISSLRSNYKTVNNDNLPAVVVWVVLAISSRESTTPAGVTAKIEEYTQLQVMWIIRIGLNVLQDILWPIC